MSESSIEWVIGPNGEKGSTWNPIRARNKLTGQVGWHCEHVSAGCANCYAGQRNKGFFQLGTRLEYAPKNRDKVEIFLDEKVLEQPLHWKKPRRIFVCSMTDLFGEFHSDEMIDKVFAVMALPPQHTFLVLTKRAERMYRYFATNNVIWEKPDTRTPVHSKDRLDDVLNAATGIADNKISDLELLSIQDRWPLPNVHLGVSVEDQKTAAERIPWLLKTPAAVRWVSYEPALGPVDFTALPSASGIGRELDCLSNAGVDPGALIPSKLDWLVCGGESGPGARPFDIQWARDVIVQCKAASVPVFIKQLGAKPILDCPPGEQGEDQFREDGSARYWTLGFIKDKKGGSMEEWPEDLRIRKYPDVGVHD